MFKPKSGIDTRMEKLTAAVGEKTSRRGFLDRLSQALLAAGAGTIAWLAPAANAAMPARQTCYDSCDVIAAACDAGCDPSCSNPDCEACCVDCWINCNVCCDAIGIPCSCPDCCGP